MPAIRPALAWTLVAAALAVGAVGWGWRGVVLAVTVLAFLLLLQFNRVVRVMKRASQMPVGRIDSAVMLNAKLEHGMSLMKVVQLAGSLGTKVGDAPETWAWRDAGDVVVTVEMARAQVARWTLERPGDGVDPTSVPDRPAE
ncbi:MAG: hypothetical protein JSR59_02605 [Proteobacteria bacterium]|nr:hypothetical protein [Pseudomonadota bacterium]